MFETLFKFMFWCLVLNFCQYTGHYIYLCFFMKQKDLKERYGKKSWVVVTGGSDGIGWEIVKQFAALEFNIIIIARNMQKLQEKKELLKTLYSDVLCEVMSYDLGKMTTVEQYQEVINSFGDRDVSVFINNAGIMIGSLAHNEPADILTTTNLLILPNIMFTKYMIEKFYEREQRGAIVNVSSLLSAFPSKTNSIYNSTKACVKQFTIGEADNHSDKIDFLCLQPGFTQTSMMLNKKNKLFGSLPETTAKGCLRALGNVVCYQGDSRQAFIVWLIKFCFMIFPESFCNLINQIFQQFIFGFKHGAKTLFEEPKVAETGILAKIKEKMTGYLNPTLKKVE